MLISRMNVCLTVKICRVYRRCHNNTCNTNNTSVINTVAKVVALKNQIEVFIYILKK